MTFHLLSLACACAAFAATTVDAKKIFWVPFPGSVSHHMLAAKVREGFRCKQSNASIYNTVKLFPFPIFCCLYLPPPVRTQRGNGRSAILVSPAWFRQHRIF